MSTEQSEQIEFEEWEKNEKWVKKYLELQSKSTLTPDNCKVLDQYTKEDLTKHKDKAKVSDRVKEEDIPAFNDEVDKKYKAANQQIRDKYYQQVMEQFNKIINENTLSEGAEPDPDAYKLLTDKLLNDMQQASLIKHAKSAIITRKNNQEKLEKTFNASKQKLQDQYINFHQKKVDALKKDKQELNSKLDTLQEEQKKFEDEIGNNDIQINQLQNENGAIKQTIKNKQFQLEGPKEALANKEGKSAPPPPPPPPRPINKKDNTNATNQSSAQIQPTKSKEQTNAQPPSAEQLKQVKLKPTARQGHERTSQKAKNAAQGGNNDKNQSSSKEEGSAKSLVRNFLQSQPQPKPQPKPQTKSKTYEQKASDIQKAIESEQQKLNGVIQKILEMRALKAYYQSVIDEQKKQISILNKEKTDLKKASSIYEHAEKTWEAQHKTPESSSIISNQGSNIPTPPPSPMQAAPPPPPPPPPSAKKNQKLKATESELSRNINKKKNQDPQPISVNPEVLKEKLSKLKTNDKQGTNNSKDNNFLQQALEKRRAGIGYESEDESDDGWEDDDALSEKAEQDRAVAAEKKAEQDRAVAAKKEQERIKKIAEEKRLIQERLEGMIEEGKNLQGEQSETLKRQITKLEEKSKALGKNKIGVESPYNLETLPDLVASQYKEKALREKKVNIEESAKPSSSGSNVEQTLQQGSKTDTEPKENIAETELSVDNPSIDNLGSDSLSQAQAEAEAEAEAVKIPEVKQNKSNPNILDKPPVQAQPTTTQQVDLKHLQKYDDLWRRYQKTRDNNPSFLKRMFARKGSSQRYEQILNLVNYAKLLEGKVEGKVLDPQDKAKLMHDYLKQLNGELKKEGNKFDSAFQKIVNEEMKALKKQSPNLDTHELSNNGKRFSHKSVKLNANNHEKKYNNKNNR
jgi:hypothetical protein